MVLSVAFPPSLGREFPCDERYTTLPQIFSEAKCATYLLEMLSMLGFVSQIAVSEQFKTIVCYVNFVWC
jgi:hypothetical protein